MNNAATQRAHWTFWLIGAVALLWNIGGAINYLMQMNVEFVATLPDTHRAIIEDRPAWATGGFAAGVFGGVLGSLLLLLRKSTAFHVFIVSLLGVLVTMVHTVNVAVSEISFNPAEFFMMILLPIIVAAMLIWYTKLALSKYWVG